jgi:hypothetical protein
VVDRGFRRVGLEEACSLERDVADRRCMPVEVGKSSREEKPAAEQDRSSYWERQQHKEEETDTSRGSAAWETRCGCWGSGGLASQHCSALVLRLLSGHLRQRQMVMWGEPMMSRSCAR